MDKPKRLERPKRVCNRPEAILVKEGQDKEWIQVYKELMGARETLKESCGIRRTRTGDILIELKAGSNAKKTAADMNTALRGKMRALPMRDKTSVEIRDIDPLVGKEELAREIVMQLCISDITEVKVKTLRMAPWGTQSAIVMMPKAYLAKEGASRKIRTGLTIASIKGTTQCGKVLQMSHVWAYREQVHGDKPWKGDLQEVWSQRPHDSCLRQRTLLLHLQQGERSEI